MLCFKNLNLIKKCFIIKCNIVTETKPQIQEAQRTLCRKIPETLRHSTFGLNKIIDKEKILKEARRGFKKKKKHFINRATRIRISLKLSLRNACKKREKSTNLEFYIQ